MATSNTTPKRLTDIAKPWITKVLKEDETENHERVIWDVGLTAFPDLAAASPSLVGDLADPSAVVPVPALVVFLEIPGVNPEQSLYIAPILAPYWLTEERVRNTIVDALASARHGRELQLAQLSVES